MPFDPSAPVDVLDAPAAPSPASAPQATFDPKAPVTPEFDPTAPVAPEHPYVTKIQADPTLSPDEKQSRIDAFNTGLEKFDFDKPVTPIERYGIHAIAAAGETPPALAVKALTGFTEQPFQGIPLPLRLAQGQLADLQAEKQRRADPESTAMADPTLGEYPDSVLDSEIQKAQARVQKFMTPENIAAMKTEQTRLADIAATKAGEQQSYANLPPATGFAQKAASVGGELAGGLTDPTNLLPLGEVDKTASLAKRLLTTGKNLSGQVAALEPVRQTLATAANEPEQTGLGAAAQRVVGGFAGGVILQGGSEMVGKLASMFKVSPDDIAGKTADDAATVIAAKTGQDKATVQEQMKQILPAAPEVKAAIGKPAAGAVPFDPQSPVQLEGEASPEATPRTAFDASGPVETEEPAPLRQAVGDAMRERAPVAAPAEAAPAPDNAPVDIGPRDASISTGDGVPTPAEQKMMADWKDQIAREQAPAAASLEQTAPQPEASHPVPPEAQPAPAPAKSGFIENSPLKTWADQVVANYGKGTQVNMTGGMDLFAARVVQGAAVLERGITDFAKWSAEMIQKYGEDLKPHLENIFRVARELHGEGDRAGTATPDDVRDFVADYQNNDHQKLIADAGRETTPASRTEALQSSVINDKSSSVNGVLKKLAGESAPRTSAIAEESGNALVRYASAAQAGPEIARAHAGIVLGDHLHDPQFANRLGGTLVEDRLQGIRAGLLKQAGEAAVSGNKAASQEFFEHAQNVTSIVGKEDSPFKTRADYEAALKDPEIQAAIQRHKETVQPIAQKQHADLGGRIAQPGIDTGAFVNLEALDKEGESVNGPKGRGTRQGDITAPYKKGTAFGQQAYGTADNYTTDYNEIARRMITGNFEESSKRQLYDQLTKDGVAVILPKGERPPEINGRVPEKIPIEQRGLPSASGARTINRVMWVDPRAYPEVRKALNVDATFKGSALSHISNILNTLQLKGPVNGVFHVANILSSIAGSQGGKSVVADLVRKLPGVNVVDALARIVSRARDVIADSAEVRQEIAKLAQTGAGRAPFEGNGPMGRLIQLVDKAARLVRNDMYDNMVQRGWAKDSEAARREFINQIGQYNPRLMGQITSKFKEWGVSPFAVAGISFNRQALRRVTASPGITPASTMANVGMRAAELGSLVATLFAAPMAINYALTGKSMGRPGTPLGAIDTGKTTGDGRAITVDPQQWTGLRRGLRITGANATATGLMKGQSHGEIIDNAVRDQIGGFLHPYAGPLVNTAATLSTGFNASFYKQAQTARPGQSQMAQNAIAAAKQLNPMVGNAIQGTNEQKQGSGPLDDLKNGRFGAAAGDALKGAAKPFLDALGVKNASVSSPEQQVKTMAGRFTDSLGIPRDTGGQESQYGALSKAVQSGDMAAAQTEMEDLVRQKAAQVQGNFTEATKIAIAKREIADYYARDARAPYTGSLQREREFKSTLDGDGQALYAAARNDRREAMTTVRALLYGH
jgi:hypothetical protein